jgi:flavin reductase (DIM6/NTAB) family NADH-FMN oxidoreductase RutF
MIVKITNRSGREEGIVDAHPPEPPTQAFLDVMAEVCTPVTVVTTIADGLPHGTTVSAFTSLSLRPPMIAVALDLTSDLLVKIRRTRRFGVNVLGVSQDRLAVQFAGKGHDKFAGVAWSLDDGLPRLVDAIGWLTCRADSFLDGGDHVLVPGRVESAVAVPAPPLAYHRRVFGTHSGFLGSTA